MSFHSSLSSKSQVCLRTRRKPLRRLCVDGRGLAAEADIQKAVVDNVCASLIFNPSGERHNS